ncbi:SSTR5 (predicted) [Pycnogonum litorale]
MDFNASVDTFSSKMATVVHQVMNVLCRNITLENGTVIQSCKDDMNGSGGEWAFGLVEFCKVLYGLICIIGLCGNTLVIYVVLRYSKMQTVTNIYILNLAIADEMFLVGLPFLIIVMAVEYWPFGTVFCKIFLTITSINQFTSSVLLTVMSADRYIAVCHPITSPRYRTPTIATIVCLTAWTVSALLMVPVYLYGKTFITNGKVTCNIIWPESKWMNGTKTFTLYSFLLGFFLPLLLIMTFYLLVIMKLKTVGPKNKSAEKRRSHRKVTILVLTVITVYVLCWLPYWIVQVLLAFSTPRNPQTSLRLIVFLLTGCLSYANSAMNPILYAFLSDNFKKSFLKAFTCAAGKDVNQHLHAENSFFPKRGKQGSGKRSKSSAGSCVGKNSNKDDPDSDNIGHDMLDPSTAITMTSRNNSALHTVNFKDAALLQPLNNGVTEI